MYEVNVTRYYPPLLIPKLNNYLTNYNKQQIKSLLKVILNSKLTLRIGEWLSMLGIYIYI